MQAAYNQFVASNPSTIQAQQLITQLLAKKSKAKKASGSDSK